MRVPLRESAVLRWLTRGCVLACGVALALALAALPRTGWPAALSIATLSATCLESFARERRRRAPSALRLARDGTLTLYSPEGTARCLHIASGTRWCECLLALELMEDGRRCAPLLIAADMVEAAVFHALAVLACHGSRQDKSS